MSMLNDPSMKEIVMDFCTESEKLLPELTEVLEQAEESSEKKFFEQFGQVIDRIMGAAKSIGADEIGLFCELGKVIAYKTSRIDDQKLSNLVTAVLFDTVDLLTKMISQIRDGGNHSLDGLDTKTFSTRLKWLSEKFKELEKKEAAKIAEANAVKTAATATPATAAAPLPGGGGGDNMKQNDIDALMASLGL